MHKPAKHQEFTLYIDYLELVSRDMTSKEEITNNNKGFYLLSI